MARGKKKQSSKNLGLVAAAAAPVVMDAVATMAPKVVNWVKNKVQNRRRKRKRPSNVNGSNRRTSGTPKQLLNRISQMETSSRPITQSGGAMIPQPFVFGGANPAVNNKKSSRIVKQDWLFDVVGDTGAGNFQAPNGYTDGAIRINPGLEYTFPWASAEAALFESYKIHSLSLHYIPTTNLNATGNIYMVPVVDPLESIPPANKEYLSGYRGVVDISTKSGGICEFPLGDQAMPLKWRYVRLYPNDQTLNLEMFDMGYFLVMVAGCADTTKQGEIWIEYDVEFFNSKPRSTLTRVIGGKVSNGGTVSAANPFGTTPVLDADSIGVSFDAASNMTIFDTTTLACSILYGGTNPVINAPTVVSGSASIGLVIGSITNSVNASATYRISVSKSPCVVNFTGSGTVTGSVMTMGTVPSNSLANKRFTNGAQKTVNELQKKVDLLTTQLEQLLRVAQQNPQKFQLLG